MAVIATVYTLVQLVVVGVRARRWRGTKAPVAAAFRPCSWAGRASCWPAVGAMISIYGCTTGSVLAAPRLLYSMAERGELPAVLGRVHPRFRTPHVAILAYAALTLALRAVRQLRLERDASRPSSAWSPTA